MGVSLYSFLSAMLWFNIFIVVATALRRRNIFIINFGVSSLFMIIAFTVFRLTFAMEIPNFTRVIRSQTFLPAIYNALSSTIFNIVGVDISLFALIVICTSAVAIYKLAKISVGYRIAVNSYADLHSMDTSREAAIVDGILKEKGKRIDIKVIKSALVTSPMMSGVFRPTIYLPAIQYPSKQLYYILLHEITHYLNKDTLYKLVVEILCAVLWWNPFVYLLRKDIDSTLELRCDYSVTSRLDINGTREYLTSLLYVCTTLEAMNSGMTLAFVGQGDASAIVQRFEIIKGYKQRSGDYRAAFTATLLAMISLFMFSFSFVFQPGFEPPTDFHEELSQPAYADAEGVNNGEYILYFDDGFCYAISEDTLKQDYKDVPIINEGDSIDVEN